MPDTAAAITARVEARLAPVLEAFRDGELAEHVAALRLLALPGSEPPWTASGLALEAGEEWSAFAEGRLVASEEIDLWFGPRVYLWFRLGEKGPVFRNARETATRVAEASAPLSLCVSPGNWTDPSGGYEAPDPYGGLPGGFAVLLVRWRGDARRGIEALLALAPDEPLLRAELERLDEEIERPEGWAPLWRIGETDVFRAARGERGAAAIRAQPENDAGILVKPVAAPLTPETRLAWRWKLDALPSAVAEDQFHTHDYLSIAVEFENGQDITYTWSAELAPEHGYRCPLPWWDRHETHVVIRSGERDLGRWLGEERPLRADYERHAGVPPTRIVAVWLIAVSLFQHGRGVGDFAAIRLLSGAGALDVL